MLEAHWARSGADVKWEKVGEWRVHNAQRERFKLVGEVQRREIAARLKFAMSFGVGSGKWGRSSFW